MSTTQRDEHFAQFAKQQFDDIAGMFMKLAYALGSEEEAQLTNDIQLYMARRAYDLALHTVEQFEQHYDWGFGTLDTPLDVLQHIPDLTELPEEQQ